MTRKPFFHFDGTVNLALVFIALGFIGSVVLWAIKMDGRVSMLEQDKIEVREVMREFRTDLREIKGGLSDLNIGVATIRGRMAETTGTAKK
jgi:hypothetical protein